MDIRRSLNVGNQGIAEAQIRRERMFQHRIRRDSSLCKRAKDKMIGKSRKRVLTLEQTYRDTLYEDSSI